MRLGFAGLGVWTRLLPEAKGTAFVLWHQLVRLGTVISGMGLVVGISALAIPFVLDALERGSFVWFVSAR